MTAFIARPPRFLWPGSPWSSRW